MTFVILLPTYWYETYNFLTKIHNLPIKTYAFNLKFLYMTEIFFVTTICCDKYLLLVLPSYGWHQSIFLSHTTKISRGCFQKEKLSFNKGNDVIRCNYSGCPCCSQAPSARKNWEEYAKARSSLKSLFISENFVELASIWKQLLIGSHGAPEKLELRLAKVEHFANGCDPLQL